MSYASTRTTMTRMMHLTLEGHSEHVLPLVDVGPAVGDTGSNGAKGEDGGYFFAAILN
ncbi:hypothetical protein ZHAS_00016787 [Anopheles sinensis]|uniref:Uncharacterized protein n=1 Tax=Anopheles sinensis TaxID=74873 RepID=A0A084WEY5_ANOSI|nr:hypothetical protein ZHAS_00016787 [Anopheles sinensis]